MELLVSGEGLASDQTAIMHFGLGNETVVKKVTITFANDKVVVLKNLKTNTINNIEEMLMEQNKIEETPG